MSIFRRQPGQVAICSIVILVTVVALASLRAADLAGAAAVLDFIGRATGIIGLVMMLLAAALSARLPGFDRYFGGLTKLWRTHHLLGAGSLLLLMAHPLLLALGAAEGGAGDIIARIFPPFQDWPAWAGWAALILMMIFLAPSFHFFGRPDYQRWKWLHRLAGPAVLLGLAHTANYGRTLTAPVETALWVFLGLLALVALVWHFGLTRRFGRRRYAVERVIMVVADPMSSIRVLDAANYDVK